MRQLWSRKASESNDVQTDNAPAVMQLLWWRNARESDDIYGEHVNRSLNIKNLLSLFSLVKLIVSMCISLCNRSASSPRQQHTEFIDIKAPRLDACGVFGAEEAHFIFRVHGVLVDLVNDVLLNIVPSSFYVRSLLPPHELVFTRCVSFDIIIRKMTELFQVMFRLAS